MSLGTLLDDAAARAPDARAVAFEGAELTYAELAAQAQARPPARHLLPLPMPNVPESIARFHGAARAGAVVVPLNPLLSTPEREQRCRSFEPAAGTAVVLFTSGTTGDPKRVELSADVLRANAEYLARDALELGADDVVYCSAPLSHVFGLTACMNATIAAGATLALVRRFDAVAALDLCERLGVTVFMGVPAMVTSLLAASEATGRAPRLRLAHIGASPLSEHELRAFEERFGARVLEGYGMSEAGGVVAITHASQARKPGSVGTVAAGQELQIADDGEVLVRSGGRWISTGDLGRLDDEGYLYLLDRKKDVILRGGYTVYPRQVEEALLAHPAIREAVVIGVPSAAVGEEVVALVVASAAVTPAELTAFTRTRVAAYAYPRLVELVDDLPRSQNGKILRREIDRTALARRLA